MPRDPAATRARILDAATAEFAEHGPAGARYDRIAARAQANKERVYAYFGNKDQLFAAVLRHHMSAFAEAHVLAEPHRAVEHVGELFDFHVEHPELTRLLLWEALHYRSAAEVPDEPARSVRYRARREALAQALDGSPGEAGALDPGHLSFALTSLVAWWFAAPQLARLHLGTDVDDPEVRGRQRELVMAAASRLLGFPRPR